MHALILRTDPVGETDVNAVLLTGEGRKIEGFARSARRLDSRVRAGLLPFTISDVSLVLGRYQWVIRSAMPVLELTSLRTSLFGLVGATVLAAIVGEATPDTLDPDTYAEVAHLFRDFHVSLAVREEDDLRVRRLAALILRAFRVSGIAPLFHRCARCSETTALLALSPSAGGTVCGSCMAALPDSRVVSRSALAALSERKIPEEQGDVRELYRFFSRFVGWHLSGALSAMRILITMCGTQDFRVR